MKVTFLKHFYKDLDRITSAGLRSDILIAIENVEKATKLSDIPDLKKLKNYRNAYRIRIGDFRIGLFIEKGTVEFARIVHRKDIYKLFP